MSHDDWRAVFARVEASCRDGGLDLAHPLSCTFIAGDLALPAGFRSDALGILLGNSGALWPILRRALRRGGALPEHPVDEHTERVVSAAVAGLPAPTHTFFSHRPYGGRYLPFQRIAHRSGFLHLSPAQLSLHPRHGPWVALRALVLVDLSGPPPPAPVAPNPCSACDEPCVPAFEAALALGGTVEEHWEAWLAIRDACPEGRASRYDAAQLAYHYRKRREHLVR